MIDKAYEYGFKAGYKQCKSDEAAALKKIEKLKDLLSCNMSQIYFRKKVEDIINDR